MNELNPRGIAGIQMPATKTRSARQTVVHYQSVGLRIKGEAALTRLAMNEALDVDDYRLSLLDGNEDRAAILMRLEVGFVNRLERLMQHHDSPFGF